MPSGTEIVDRPSESGYDGFAVKPIVLTEVVLRSVGAIHSGITALWIDEPNEENAACNQSPTLLRTSPDGRSCGGVDMAYAQPRSRVRRAQ